MAAIHKSTFVDRIFHNHSGFSVVARIDRGEPNRRWQYREKFLLYPEKHNAIYQTIQTWMTVPNYDIYLCMQLLDEPRRVKRNITKVTNIWADLDTCHPSKCLVAPSIAWETSPNRYQAVWLLECPIIASDGEHISKRIAYYHADDGADKSGHDLTQILRFPCTRNWKYSGAPLGSLVIDNQSLYRISDFRRYPDVEYQYIMEQESTLPKAEPIDFELPSLVEWFYDEHNKEFNYDQYSNDNRGYDKSRSWAVFQILRIGREQGLTNGEMVSILQEFGPFLGKVADEGQGWANKEVPRMFDKIDESHPHQGTPCYDASCLNISKKDKEWHMLDDVKLNMSWIPSGFGVHSG